MYMLVRNRVKDYKIWKSYIDSHAAAHEESGLKIINLWQDVDDPNNIFFMLKVSDREKADRFINAPESAQAGIDSGVIDGEMHYIEDADDL